MNTETKQPKELSSATNLAIGIGTTVGSLGLMGLLLMVARKMQPDEA